jgi:CRISPR-associated endonuclease/helicase Cas3
MVYYAHSMKDKDKNQWHLLKNHLEDTSATAAAFASSFGADKLALVAGLLHDVGKYAPEFQQLLEGSKLKVDHSTSGAVESEKLYGQKGRLLSYIISGHHCGLPDWGSKADEGSLDARLKKKLNDYSAFTGEIELPLPQDIVLPKIRPTDGMQGKYGKGFSAHFLVRFIYSCLVDADFLDTEKALNPAKAAVRRGAYSLDDLSDALDRFLDNLRAKAEDSNVNRKRAQVLANCRDKALYAPGLFTLTVPTGGGKTLSSLSFALKHALAHGKERVIYVVPYTTIIEQNAAVFKKALGEESVLEHHSNFSYPQESLAETESENAVEITQKLELATENWDMPVIVTTNVQFYESIFASRGSKCRKLHNIANSVIIIDEAQMIPTGFLKPCLYALAELVTNYHTTVVLCTATQPAIEKLLPAEIKPIEIIDAPVELYEALKRVQVHNIGNISDEELAQKLLGHDRVLCVVNSKKHARLLYERIGSGGSFHLSTRMCSAHRSKKLETIKNRLRDGKECRVVSTQLIEAGVDIDFPAVYRSMAGTDSIAQSAGRCNREGGPVDGQVYVFWPEKHGLPRGWLSRTATLGGLVIERYKDPLELDAVKEYFTSLYDIDAAQLDKEGILDDIREQEKCLRFPFRSIAEKFKLIDDNTFTVVIPWDEICRKTLKEAARAQFLGIYTRRLQRYGVEVYEKEFQEMLGLGVLEVVAGRFYVLKDEAFSRHYDEETGLTPFTESMFLNDMLLI